jgi:cellulose synthase/poly-beta-1,6-N-acetylglucosamine synthase-like glycosyltransferase
MLTDWIYWLSSMPRDELIWLLAPILAIDGLRYCCTAICVWLVDLGSRILRVVTGRIETVEYPFCPSVSLIVAGLNEADCLEKTLTRIWGTYPKLQFIIVDDGSTDGMSGVANRFAAEHPDTIVITKRRGGKSSALNAGLAMSTSEIIIIVDADSELSDTAIWEIVQPLSDPQVAAVGGNVIVRNPNTNLLTRLQTFEYLRSILLGRMITSRLGILGIISGAFGAFRRSTLIQIGGWDVGPGEDEDLVLRIRKLGLRIDFAPYAECRTDVPESWRVLTRQRRRWEWAVVTFESRKHIDMANPFNKHFGWSNFLLFAERWLYNLIMPLCCWIYILWYLWFGKFDNLGFVVVLFYLTYVLGDFLQYLIILDYSNQKSRDVRLILLLPLLPFYQFYQRVVTTYAILEEIFTRRSFKDGFVPYHVREVTWHW